MTISQDEWDSYLEANYEEAFEVEEDNSYVPCPDDEYWQDDYSDDWYNDAADREARWDWRD